MRALDVGLLTISWQACLQEKPPLAQVLAARPLKQSRARGKLTQFSKIQDHQCNAGSSMTEQTVLVKSVQTKDREPLTDEG